MTHLIFLDGYQHSKQLIDVTKEEIGIQVRKEVQMIKQIVEDILGPGHSRSSRVTLSRTVSRPATHKQNKQRLSRLSKNKAENV